MLRYYLISYKTRTLTRNLMIFNISKTVILALYYIELRPYKHLV